MFKGLKSKLEDSSKKLQASVQASVQSVQQYGEQFTQQVRNAASDAGSDSGASITNRFSSVGASSSDQNALNLSTGNAIMEEVEEGDLLGIDFPKRERTNSGGSHHSMESSLSSYFQSVPGMTSTLDAAYDSDNDSVVDKRWSESLTGDQFNNVFGKLQGRAVNYRGQYRELTKQYNSLVDDFNKHKKLMTKQQDTFIDKVNKLREDKKLLSESAPKLKKYEDMLEKCKAKIVDLEEKKKKLGEENATLKSGIMTVEGDSGMAELAAERVASEWRQRVEKVESDWVDRSNKIDSDHALQLATAKAEMHLALEKKDGEIESLRSKCRTLEIQDGQANERWQTKVDELQSIVKALESEKTDMIEKLSAAKQQGVQAVRDEEEQRRKDLEADWQKKMEEAATQAEKRLEDLKDEHSKANESLLSELNLLKTGVSTEESDEKSKLEELEAAYTEKLTELQAQLDAQIEAAKRKESDLAQSADFNSQKQKSDLEHLIKEHEEMIERSTKQFEIERTALLQRLETAERENIGLRRITQQTTEDFARRTKEEHEERIEKEQSLKSEIARLENLLEDGESVRSSEERNVKSQHLKEVQGLAEEVEQLKDELQLKTMELEEAIKGALAVKEDCEENLNGMRRTLEEKTKNMRQLEDEKQQLEVELAESKELSAIHEHLRQELEEARQQQINVELRVREMSERAESAEKALEKDRAELETCRRELEETVRQHQEAKTNLIQDLAEVASIQPLQSQETLVDVASDEKSDDLASSVARLERLNEQLRNELESLRTEKDLFAEKLTTTTAAESDAKKNMEEYLEKLKAVEQEKEALSQQVAALQTETDSLVAQANDKVKEAQEELAELKFNMNKTEEKAAGLESEKDIVEKELQDVRDSLLELQSKLESSSTEEESALLQLTGQLNEKNEELNELKMKLKKQEEIVEQNSISHSEQQTRIERLEADLTESTKQLETLKSNLATVEEQLAKATSESKKLEESLEKESSSQQDAHAELVEQVRVKEQTIEELTTKLDLAAQSGVHTDDLTRKLKEAEDELEKRVNDMKEMETLVIAEKSRVDALETEYQTKLTGSERRAKDAEESLQLTQEQLTAVKTKLQETADLQNIASVGKVRELEDLCERMRVEFIAKEKILSELRSELETVKAKGTEESSKLVEELSAANKTVEELKNDLEGIRSELTSQRATYETTIDTTLAERTKEKAEEEQIREQYSIALENLRTELATAQEAISSQTSLQEEKTRLLNELSELKTTHEEYQKTQKEAADESLAQLKLKAEKKIAKMKLSKENDVAAAQAELMLQIDQLQASLSEKDRKLDEQVIEKAKLEQQLMSHEDLKNEVEDRREKEKQLTAKMAEVSRKLLTFEAENRQMTEKMTGLESQRENLSADLEDKSKLLTELEQKVNSLEANNEESFRKAAAKQENDSKKVVRELQREVKQLYVELNEKAEALDAARTQLETLSSHGSETADSAKVQKISSLDAMPDRDFMMEEELETTRRKLKECHREIEGLREANGKLERNLDSLVKKSSVNGNSNRQSANISYETGFADPAEAEYLKNVLFRYMAEREDLGKESVTLARVIGTVAKFDTHQLQTVLTREETRVAGGWVGGTVAQMSSALSAATGATRHH